MDVREAVAAAKKYVQEIFSEENISNLGLEEVEFDEPARIWSVTLGFSRPWDTAENPFVALGRSLQRPRAYRIVRISDETGKVLSLKSRKTTDVS